MSKFMWGCIITLGILFSLSMVSCELEDESIDADLDYEGKAIALAADLPPVQSNDPNHPGSSVYPYISITYTDIKLPANGKMMRVWKPAGVTTMMPVVFWGGGKSMGSPTFNQKMFEHLAKKGIIVVNVQFEGNFFDIDFVKFGRWFNNGVKLVLSQVTNADPNNVYYAGHSLGAQVSIIAAGLATGADTTNQFVDPRGLIVHAFDNSCGPNCSGDLTNPAKGYAVKVASTVQASILEYADDTIAGPSKKYAENLYAKLPSAKKQWVLVKGKSFGTALALDANHNTAASAGSTIFNIGGKIYCNALDWHMVWKYTTGVTLAVSGYGPSAYGYVFGTDATNGGTTTGGVILMHDLKAQNF